MQIFEDANTQAVLLVNASNAFNNLNRQTALRNIHLNCPSIAKALINTYRSDTQLFVDGVTFLSQEIPSLWPCMPSALCLLFNT